LEQIVSWFARSSTQSSSRPASGQDPATPARPQGWFAAWWNRGLPAQVVITHRILWPLLLLPIALLNQLVAPHPVWIVLVVTLLGLYGVGLIWVRSQALTVNVRRKRLGSVLVVGDSLREEFELENQSPWPVLWAEFIDHSTLPGYNAGRVVGSAANTNYRWHSVVECRQRGIYRMGPHELVLGDPFGLFQLSIRNEEHELILIYPRVAHLPVVALPRGDTSGTTRRRRPSSGPLPSASVRDYRATDSLRYVHWPLTAHRGALMVKELEIEPSGGVWIVLDLHGAAHRTVDEVSTLEFSVVVAASLASELLTRSDRRTVGLLTVSDHEPFRIAPSLEPGWQAELRTHSTDDANHPANSSAKDAPDQAVVVLPQAGPAHFWRMLAALAPVQATTLSLADLLRTNRGTLGSRGMVIIVTPDVAPQPGAQDWTAELLHLQSTGLASSVILITPPDAGSQVGEAVRSVLARHDIPVQTLAAGTRLPSALTFRRTRKVVRNTPTGGAVTYEVEEEVS
jgi:uncharacterized protein (DUF58 family)